MVQEAQAYHQRLGVDHLAPKHLEVGHAHIHAVACNRPVHGGILEAAHVDSRNQDEAFLVACAHDLGNLGDACHLEHRQVSAAWLHLDPCRGHRGTQASWDHWVQPVGDTAQKDKHHGAQALVILADSRKPSHFRRAAFSSFGVCVGASGSLDETGYPGLPVGADAFASSFGEVWIGICSGKQPIFWQKMQMPRHYETVMRCHCPLVTGSWKHHLPVCPRTWMPLQQSARMQTVSEIERKTLNQATLGQQRPHCLQLATWVELLEQKELVAQRDHSPSLAHANVAQHHLEVDAQPGSERS